MIKLVVLLEKVIVMIYYNFNAHLHQQVNYVIGMELNVLIDNVFKPNIILIELVKHFYQFVLLVTQVQILMDVQINYHYVLIINMNKIV